MKCQLPAGKRITSLLECVFFREVYIAQQSQTQSVKKKSSFKTWYMKCQLPAGKHITSLLECVFFVLINISIKTLFFTAIAVIEITTFRAKVSAIGGFIFLTGASVLATVVVGVTCIRMLLPHLRVLFFYSGCCKNLPITSGSLE